MQREMYLHVFTMVCLSESIKCDPSQSAILRKSSYKEPARLRRLLEIDSTWSKFILRMTHVKKRQVRLKIRTTRLSLFTLEQRSNDRSRDPLSDDKDSGATGSRVSEIIEKSL